MKYTVRYFMDNNYEVIENESGESKYQGSLSDCEAWIRLTEGGYM